MLVMGRGAPTTYLHPLSLASLLLAVHGTLARCVLTGQVAYRGAVRLQEDRTRRKVG